MAFLCEEGSFMIFGGDDGIFLDLFMLLNAMAGGIWNTG